jgi:hypothetical protein
MSRGPAMRRISWWSVDLVSRLLDVDERDAVRGDLTESGASGGSALCDVLGLVVRRQAALWMDWRPWLALAGVVAPLGVLLSHVSRWWADGTAIYAWLYVNNWTWAYLDSPGARRDLVNISTNFFLQCVTLIGWSWTSGFVLGSLSRRTLWVTGTLFCLVVVGGTHGTVTTGRANPFNATVFSLTFYSLVFPWILRTLLVLLPALRGMRSSLQRTSLPLLRTMLWAVAIAMLTAWTAQGLESSVIFGRHVVPADPGLDGGMGTVVNLRPLRLLPLVMVWPVAYMLARTSWRRWRGDAVSP